MNIILITQGISRVVQPLLDSEHTLLAILESAPRGFTTKPKKTKLLGKLVSLKNIFKALKPGPGTLEELCKGKKVPYRFMTSSDDAGLEDWIKSLIPDLIVVFSMSQLLRENIFSIPKYGTINLHASFLPEYRGPNPDFWQYYDQILNPGVTVHFIDAGEDTGDVILQKRVSIPLGTKSPARLDKLVGEVGVRLLLSAIESIENGSLKRMPQPVNSPTVRARNIKKEEHQEVIRWYDWPIERIWHVMRGTELWLDCIQQPTGLYQGQRWIIGDFAKSDLGRPPERIGNVMKDSTGYFVSCRDGKIRLDLKFSVKGLLRSLYLSLNNYYR